MTIVITTEIEQAFDEYQNEIVDWYLDGQPIRRKDCMDTYSRGNIIDFAAGFQAAIRLYGRGEQC